jgi:integrase
MASISNINGRRVIQFVGDDGKRRPIRLGQCDARTADSIKLHVERLLEAKRLGMPLHTETVHWLGAINDVLHGRISRFGLCEPRMLGLRGQMPLARMLDDFIARRTDLKPGTVTTLKQTRDKLVEFFGETKPIGAINLADANDFKRHRRKTDSVAYVSKQIQLSRQFFKDAVEREILIRNPFAKVKAGTQKNPSRQRFIAHEIIDRAIEAAPDIEWKLIIAFSRYGGMRVPSEVLELRWNDIQWDEGRIHVRASKTEHHVGREARDTPLFPELRKLLREARAIAPADATFIITRYRSHAANLRTQFMRILEDAGIEPWPKLFQNLRSTRQTELTEIYPAHVVCSWVGNTEEVAQGHYLQVTQDHFSKAAGMSPGQPNSNGNDKENDEADVDEPGDENDRRNDAKSDAASARTTSQDAAPQIFAGSATLDAATTNDDTRGVADIWSNVHMGAVGFEPTKAEPPDLQSGPFGHSGTRPSSRARREAGGE